MTTGKFAVFSFEWSHFFSGKLKNKFKKVNLNNSNPLFHLPIQSCSLTNSVLKFIEISIFKQQLSRIPTNNMTSSNFCSIADLPHSLPIYRSSRSQMLFTIGVLKSFTIFSRKYLCWSLFIIKFIKKRLHHRCFLVHIATFLRTALFIEHLLLLRLDLFLVC